MCLEFNAIQYGGDSKRRRKSKTSMVGWESKLLPNVTRNYALRISQQNPTIYANVVSCLITTGSEVSPKVVRGLRKKNSSCDSRRVLAFSLPKPFRHRASIYFRLNAFVIRAFPLVACGISFWTHLYWYMCLFSHLFCLGNHGVSSRQTSSEAKTHWRSRKGDNLIAFSSVFW